ncbi:ProQ/FINO family protein [Ideonella sp. DXS29W]|uniref:ProQ/FINO family protein n=1 Tax=Ideonella lacteola TaxID=2984193 RepID=A0ABU9BQH6_9BURK
MTANDLPTSDTAGATSPEPTAVPPTAPTTPDNAVTPDAPVASAEPSAAVEASAPTEVVAEASASTEAASVTSPASSSPQGGEPLSPAACAEKLKSMFPALFTGPAKPIKLRIQADIQTRAPGVFTKASLSGFLRRYTGGTGYLIALTRAPHRFDLDGQPAGEISAEHRQAAADELARRRQTQESRRQAEEDQRRERAQLLRAFETTTLTKDNFCALKGIAPEALDAVLAQARQEAEEFARQRPAHFHPGGRPDGRGPRPDRRPPHAGHERGGARAEHRPDPRGPQGPAGAAPSPRGPRGPQDGQRQGAPRGERGPRPPRPAR